jgi:hypothetical protein
MSRTAKPLKSTQTHTPQRACASTALTGQARTAKAMAKFLAEFAQCGNVLRSAQAVGVGRKTVYDWLKREPFKALYDDAHEDALDQLEEEARRRAVDGVLKPVYQQGHRVGTIKEYSDVLLITLLKGKRPDTFRERVEHTGKDGGALTLEVVRKMSDEEIERRLAEIAARRLPGTPTP